MNNNILFIALISTPLVGAALVLLLYAADIKGKKWLAAFFILNLVHFILIYLPTMLLQYAYIEIVFLAIEYVGGHFGPWISLILPVSIWIAMLGFLVHQYPHYQNDSENMKVLEKKSEGGKSRVVINPGFSWPCFFLGPLWAWHKRMIGVGFGLLAGNIVFLSLAALFSELGTGFGAMSIGSNYGPYNPLLEWIPRLIFQMTVFASWLFVAAFFFDTWYENYLEKRGYKQES